MSHSQDYKVSFGQIARTLLYEDSLGSIRFGFDISPSNPPAKEKWTIGLEQPVDQFKQAASIKDEKLRIAEQKRIETAFKRIKDYLISSGYQVKVWPDEFEAAK